jgi:hypothetical protein
MKEIGSYDILLFNRIILASSTSFFQVLWPNAVGVEIKKKKKRFRVGLVIKGDLLTTSIFFKIEII